jgi:uncharacterized protein
MQDRIIFQKIGREVEKLFKHSKDPSHDFSHPLRVFRLARLIQIKEGGNKLIIGTAALLHDLHQALAQKHKKFFSGKDSLKEAEKILNKIKFPKEKIHKVLHCVEVHDHYNFTKEGNKARTIEAKIIQDADNLDALGAIGIARTFIFGGTQNRPMWKGQITSNRFYKIEKLNESTIQHFYDKLLRLKNNMNTRTGKRLATKRHKFILKFLKQFFKEWKN